MNYSEYWNEIESIAESLINDAMYTAIDENPDDDVDAQKETAMEQINDCLLHETIDGHQWVIYYAYNLDVIQHSNNDDYMSDNFGGDEIKAAIDNGGLIGLHSAVAFWAMYADVQDKLSDAMDNYEIESTED